MLHNGFSVVWPFHIINRPQALGMQLTHYPGSNRKEMAFILVLLLLNKQINGSVITETGELLLLTLVSKGLLIQA